MVPLVLALGLTGALASVLPSVNQYLTAQSGRAVQQHAVTGLFAAVGRLVGLRSLEDPEFQDRLRFAQQAGSSGPGQVLSGSIAILQAAITLAGFLVTLAVLNPVMTVVVAVAAIPAIFLERGTARRQAALLRGITHAQRRQFFYADLLSSLPAAKEIRLFGLSRFFRDRMLGELGEVQAASMRTDRRVLTVSTGLAVLGAGVACAGMLWAVLAATAGHLTVGDLAMLVAALGSVTVALTVIINSAGHTYQALLMFRSYREVLATAHDLPVPARPAPLPAAAPGHRAGRRLVPLRAGQAVGAARGDAACSRMARPPRSWGTTARARARWSSCCAGSTTRTAAGSCGTAPTCATWTRPSCGTGSARCSRTT